MSWVVYNAVGIRKHGFLGYLKLQSRARRASAGPILLLLVPLEFFSNIVVRPVTLALRLFANMFAGHLLLILFALGGEYLLLHDGHRGTLRSASSPGSLFIADRVPGAAGAVPAGVRLRPPERHVHLRCSRRRALRVDHEKHKPKGTSRARMAL